MRIVCRNLITFVAILGAAGCTRQTGEPEADIATTQSSISTSNALSYNRLVYNRLVYNRLAQNRLVYNSLSENRLVYNSLDQLETTGGGRELLRYIARCALDGGEMLITEHAGVTYEFAGQLNLAPEWKHGPLSAGQARIVSACLIAHVNAYGVSVPISIRASGLINACSQEISDYALYEATFFGDIFGTTLQTYACLGGNPEIAAALSSTRALRVCADPTSDCQVVSLGYCRNICDDRTHHYGWTNCWAGSVRYGETVSTFLQDDYSTGCKEKCNGNGKCKYECADQASILDCGEHDKCSVRCKDDSYCSLDATHSDTIKARVQGGSLMEIDCHGAETCQAICKGTDSRCEIDCQEADSCRAKIQCKSGAKCSLTCSPGASDCGFSRCDGQLRSCPGDVIVCNQECPSVT